MILTMTLLIFLHIEFGTFSESHNSKDVSKKINVFVTNMFFIVIVYDSYTHL